ncbi:MAG: hypothetical protein JXB39_07845 [Deltaproteobacteria bacterium]|nr:hypothetical protein [Deltaproteobacteria bacterium]
MAFSLSPQEALEAYQRVVSGTPTEVRVAAAVAALLLLFVGARLYRLALVLPAILGGAFVASALPPGVGPVMRLLVGVLLSLLGGLLLFFMEKVGVLLIGAMLAGWLTWVIWPIVAGLPAPWWALGLGALAGMVAFPAVFPAAVRWITSAMGALLGAWAAGYPTNALVILALAALGVMFQYLTTRRAPDDDLTR